MTKALSMLFHNHIESSIKISVIRMPYRDKNLSPEKRGKLRLFIGYCCLMDISNKPITSRHISLMRNCTTQKISDYLKHLIAR